MNGKLIVLEGIDGSGKSSQYELICKKLNADGIKFYNTDFPRYDKESSALIRLYLNGEFGTDPEDVNAYAASTFYAVDRYASYKDDWGKFYESGTLIFSDRYTTSNAVHQGCKVPTDQLNDYFSWLRDFEYLKMGLPQPDLVLYLDIPLELAEKRRHIREAEGLSKADIHEKDSEYLAKCLKTADMACRFFNWKRVASLNSDGSERSIDDINEEIYSIISEWIKK